MTIRFRGKIEYTSTKPERKGAIRGREDFFMTEEAGGTLVLHSHSEIDDPPPVIRDNLISWNGNTGRPYQCTVRLNVGSQFVGCGWMNFTDNQAECQTFSKKFGRISQTITLTDPVTWLVAHQIIGDGLLTQVFKEDKPGKVNYKNMMLTSPDHRGATGPELFPMSFSLRLVKKEKIEIKAGEFSALHFRVEDTGAGGLPEEHPPYDLWVSNDKYRFFLKGGVGGYMQTWYELTELTRETDTIDPTAK